MRGRRTFSSSSSARSATSVSAVRSAVTPDGSSFAMFLTRLKSTASAWKSSEARIIRPVSEDPATVKFQFTQESREGDRYEYRLETTLTLDKQTGAVTCELPGLATMAQEELDGALVGGASLEPKSFAAIVNLR